MHRMLDASQGFCEKSIEGRGVLCKQLIVCVCVQRERVCGVSTQ